METIEVINGYTPNMIKEMVMRFNLLSKNYKIILSLGELHKNKGFEMKDLIYPRTFVAINSDAFVEHGIEKGTIVFVAGTKAVPVSEEDPYTQRVKMFVHILDEEKIDTSSGLFLMDPHSLINISSEENKRLLDFNYPEDEEGEE